MINKLKEQIKLGRFRQKGSPLQKRVTWHDRKAVILR